VSTFTECWYTEVVLEKEAIKLVLLLLTNVYIIISTRKLLMLSNSV